MPGLIHTTGDISFATPDPTQVFFDGAPGTWRGMAEVFWGAVTPPRREGGGGGHGGALRQNVQNNPFKGEGVSQEQNQAILAVTALLAMYYDYYE